MRGSSQLRAPRPGQTSAQLNFLNTFAPSLGGSSYNRPSYNAPNNNNNNNVNNIDTDVISINNQGPFNNNRDPDVIVGQDPRAVDPGEIMMRLEHRISHHPFVNLTD